MVLTRAALDVEHRVYIGPDMRVKLDEARAELCDPLSELALELFATEVARSILHQGGAATDMEADRVMRALERELAFYQSFGLFEDG